MHEAPKAASALSLCPPCRDAGKIRTSRNKLDARVTRCRCRAWCGSSGAAGRMQRHWPPPSGQPCCRTAINWRENWAELDDTSSDSSSRQPISPLHCEKHHRSSLWQHSRKRQREAGPASLRARLRPCHGGGRARLALQQPDRRGCGSLQADSRRRRCRHRCGEAPWLQQVPHQLLRLSWRWDLGAHTQQAIRMMLLAAARCLGTHDASDVEHACQAAPVTEVVPDH